MHEVLLNYVSLVLFGFGLLTFGASAYTIEGIVVVPTDANSDWFINTRIHVDGDLHIGFVKPDGSFEVSNVPSGSYMVEVVNPTYVFHGARVDITSKGRIRARRLNAPQPNAVKELPYPLRLNAAGKAVYFKPREQLRTIDLLLNPNVLYVLVPLLLVMLLTKLVNTSDPELQKEMQQMNILNPQQQMADLLSSFSLFGGNNERTSSTDKKSLSSKRRKSLEKNRLNTNSLATAVDNGEAIHHHHSTSRSVTNRKSAARQKKISDN